MISLRYHLVSIVAVFMALAVGVVLGGGPLSEVGRSTDSAALAAQEKRADTLGEQLAAGQSAADFQDRVAESLAPGAVEGMLERRPVTILALPGADEETVTALGDLVASAGGSVASTYQIGDNLVDAGERPLVDALGSQLLDRAQNTGVPAKAATYDRIGQLIGRGIGSIDDVGEPVDATSTSIVSGLDGAALLTGRSDAERRSSLVLLVIGDEPDAESGADSILGSVATGIGAQTDGVVVVGSTASASGGLLGAVRSDAEVAQQVSSVDSVQTEGGRVVAVLALARAAEGQRGHWGAVAAPDGALPAPTL